MNRIIENDLYILHHNPEQLENHIHTFCGMNRHLIDGLQNHKNKMYEKTWYERATACTLTKRKTLLNILDRLKST